MDSYHKREDRSRILSDWWAEPLQELNYQESSQMKDDSRQVDPPSPTAQEQADNLLHKRLLFLAADFAMKGQLDRLVRQQARRRAA